MGGIVVYWMMGSAAFADSLLLVLGVLNSGLLPSPLATCKPLPGGNDHLE